MSLCGGKRSGGRFIWVSVAWCSIATALLTIPGILHGVPLAPRTEYVVRNDISNASYCISRSLSAYHSGHLRISSVVP